MHITQNNIFDALSNIEHVSMIPAGKIFHFQQMSLLLPDEKLFDPATLYICESGTLPQKTDLLTNDICIVCIGSTDALRNYSATHEVSIIAVSDRYSLIYVVNIIFTMFNDLTKWSYQMNAAISDHIELRCIMDYSLPVFSGTLMMLVNSSFHIVASSNNNVANNEYLQNLLDTGDLSENFIISLSSDGHLKESPLAVYIVSPNCFGCPYALFPFFRNRIFYGFTIVFYTEQSAPSSGQLELFTYFSKKIRNYYLQEIHIHSGISTPLESLIDDLLTDPENKHLNLIGRARSLLLPTDDTYRIGVIQFQEYSISQAEHLLQKLKQDIKLPCHKILIHNNSILMLMHGDLTEQNIQELYQGSINALGIYLDLYSAYAGFSFPSFPLKKINVAYNQAISAINYGLMLLPEDKIYFYSTFYIYELLGNFSNRHDLNDIYINKLDALVDSEDSQFDNLHLLKTYLLSDRSISTTARLMHLHRNSVIYRLNKIQDYLSLNLDDENVRLHLMISFKILDLKNGYIEHLSTS